MRKLFLLMMLCCTLIASAQETKDVVRFLNIPVDGSKSEMIDKLKKEGFEYTYDFDWLEGVFNDTPSIIKVTTNRDKVNIIGVIDKTETDANAIKKRFNNLIEQFSNNNKYYSSSDSLTIPEDENISYEMDVNNKLYLASFYQKPSNIDSIAKAEFDSLYSEKPQLIENPKISDILYRQCLLSLRARLYNNWINKRVSFTISEKNGKFRIMMFYVNEYNKSNGSDL